MFINNRYYIKHALERMAPANAEVRAVLEKRALKKYPLRYPLELEINKKYNKDMYKKYVEYISSRNISPEVIENTISIGAKEFKLNNTIEYLTKEIRVVTNIFGDIVTVHRIS